MAAKKPSPKDSIVKIQNSLALDQINELIHDPKKLFWLNFKTGFVRGLGGVLGAAIAIVTIGFLVSYFGGLPIIGQFLHNLSAATK